MYLGNIPATSFEAVKKDRFTGLTGTGVTLSHSVTNVQDIVVWVNSVKQDYNNYSVNGTALTLGGSLVSADVVQVLYVGRTFQTVNPPADSVGPSQTAPTIITGQTAETSIATDDTILIHDTSASALRKMTRANFVSGIGGTNTPAFQAYASSSQSQTNDTFTKIQCNTEDFDVGGNYDNSTNYRFTPTTSGKYCIYGQAHCNAGTGNVTRLTVAIYKNGTDVAKQDTFIDTSDTVLTEFTGLTTTVESANGSSDYFELYARLRTYNGSTVTIEGGAGKSFFGAYKIIE